MLLVVNTITNMPVENKLIKRIKDSAESLYLVRKEIEEFEEKNRIIIQELKEKRDSIQASLLVDMNKNGLKSFKIASGDSIVVGSKKGVDIVNEVLAFKWCLEHKAVSINKLLVAQKMKDSENIPPGFNLVVTEFISVRRSKDKKALSEDK